MNVDPPDLGFVATAVRLLRVWKEQWRLVLLGLICAAATTGLSLDDPDPDPPRDRQLDRAGRTATGSSLWPYILIVVVLSALRFGTNFTRRYATARVGIRVEARMRELLYQAYLRFPRAFYDQHATGQVVSRATNDLYPIRYFIGWGMVQGAQSLDDDHRRRGRPHAREPQAGVLRAGRDAARRPARVVVRRAR